MPRVIIDLQDTPDLHFRIHCFSVPEASRAELEDAMHRKKAAEEVRGYYRLTGLDGPATMERWGVRAETGDYQAPPRMQ
jgi:hypothetical protein